MRSKVDPVDLNEFLDNKPTCMLYLEEHYEEYLEKTAHQFIVSLLNANEKYGLSDDQASWAAAFVYKIAAKMGVNPITGARISRQSH